MLFRSTRRVGEQGIGRWAAYHGGGGRRGNDGRITRRRQFLFHHLHELRTKPSEARGQRGVSGIGATQRRVGLTGAMELLDGIAQGAHCAGLTKPRSHQRRIGQGAKAFHQWGLSRAQQLLPHRSE